MRRVVPSFLVATEGYTERIYLDHLRERNMGCMLEVKKAPHRSPRKMLDYTRRMVREKGLSSEDGDRAYIVFDRDYTPYAEISEVMAEAKKNGTGVVFSKPCFEIVYLAHFTDDLQRFKTPEDVQY